MSQAPQWWILLGLAFNTFSIIVMAVGFTWSFRRERDKRTDEVVRLMLSDKNFLGQLFTLWNGFITSDDTKKVLNAMRAEWLQSSAAKDLAVNMMNPVVHAAILAHDESMNAHGSKFDTARGLARAAEASAKEYAGAVIKEHNESSAAHLNVFQRYVLIESMNAALHSIREMVNRIEEAVTDAIADLRSRRIEDEKRTSDAIAELREDIRLAESRRRQDSIDVKRLMFLMAQGKISEMSELVVLGERNDEGGDDTTTRRRRS